MKTLKFSSSPFLKGARGISSSPFLKGARGISSSPFLKGVRGISFLTLILTLILPSPSFSQITDRGNYLQIVTRQKDTTVLPKQGIYLQKSITKPDLVYLYLPGRTTPWNLTPADYGYTTSHELKAVIEGILFKNTEKTFIRTYDATADTMVFENLYSFSVGPLESNTDTIKVFASPDSLGTEAAGSHNLIGKNALIFSDKSQTGAPLEYFRVITKNGAGCVIVAKPF